jgi:hypothetical protein
MAADATAAGGAEPPDSGKVHVRHIPRDYEALLRTWNNSAYFYQGLAYALSIGGVVSGLGVTYYVGAGHDSIYATWLGIAGAACAAISGVVRPMQIGNRYRNAWRMLNVCRLRFESDVTVPLSQLCETVARCELIVGDFELGAAEGRIAPEDRPRQRKTKAALRVYEFFLDWHRDTSRETLLELLKGQPDFVNLKDLSQPNLVIVFAQRCAAAVMAAQSGNGFDTHR